MFIRKLKKYLPNCNHSVRHFNNHFWVKQNDNNIFNLGIKNNFINTYGKPEGLIIDEKYKRYKIPINKNDIIGTILLSENKVFNLYSPLDNSYLNNFNDIDLIKDDINKNYLIQLDANSDILRETYFNFLK